MLIFCSSRKGCESTARHVSKFLKKFSVNVRNGESEFFDVTSAVDALRRCPVGLDPILEETFPSGVAYHHAGLTVFIYFVGAVSFIISHGIFLIFLSFECLNFSWCLIGRWQMQDFLTFKVLDAIYLFCRLRKERLLKPATAEAFYVS